MKIYPFFGRSTEGKSSYQLFLDSMGQLLEQILPTEVLALQSNSELFLQTLTPLLPLVHWAQLEEGSNTFSVTLLSEGEFSHGTGRFVSDTLSRRLVLGKILEIGGTRTLSFYFFQNDARKHLINERWVIADTPETADLIRKKLPALMQELQLTQLAISKVRRFLSLKPEAFPGHQTAVQEFQHLSSFEEMHQAIGRLTAEKTISEIRDTIAPVYERQPKVFDRDILEEIKPLLTIYNEPFAGRRKLSFVSRLICYHFYFKKMLEERCRKDTSSRHVLIKIFREKGVVKILVALNLFGNNEVLKKHHLIGAIRNCLNSLEEIEDSFFIDNSVEYRPVFYIEMQEKKGLSFSQRDLTDLRTNLPIEIKQGIQSVLNPLFMLRNDEDHLRHIIVLSRELRCIRDIPQLVISFEEQTVNELIFSVVLLRVVKQGGTPPKFEEEMVMGSHLDFKEILTSFKFKTTLRELKNIGWIKNKYGKEVAIFKVSLSKTPFLRKDWSLDLPQARLTILNELHRLFGNVRDYNGGILSKQLDTLKELKRLLENVATEYAFALESFFFSLEPLVSQAIISPSLLKEGFVLLLELVETQSTFKIYRSSEGISAGLILDSLEAKERFILALEAARTKFELAYSLTHIRDLSCLIVVFPSRDPVKRADFENYLSELGCIFSR